MVAIGNGHPASLYQQSSRAEDNSLLGPRLQLGLRARSYVGHGQAS